MTEKPDPAALSGLQQLHLAFHPDAPPVGIGITMGFSLESVEEGRVVFVGTPGRAVYNPIGTVHGGYAATLLDSALGCAIHSTLAPGQAYSTAELKISYLRAMTEATGPVRAEGKALHVGRRIGFAEGRITDEAGRVYATASTTCVVFERT
jgi:uncharacterized protein (TIGR00369 family)